MADLARARVEYSHPERAVLQRYVVLLANLVADLSEQEALRHLAFDYGAWVAETTLTLSPAEQVYLLTKVAEEVRDRYEWMMQPQVEGLARAQVEVLVRQ